MKAEQWESYFRKSHIKCIQKFFLKGIAKKAYFLYIEVISSLANPLQTCQNVTSRYRIGKLVTAEVCECLKVSPCVAGWWILASGFKERC